MLDIARDLSASASVHALTGSSQPGAVPPLVPLGAAAQGFDARRAAATHPDAEVIDLAARVKRLAERHQGSSDRVVRLEQRVLARHPRPPKPVSNETFQAYHAAIRPTEERLGLARLRKARRRMLSRLCRWIDRLASLEPRGMAALAAKADASLVARTSDKFDMHTDALADAVQRDVVRVASAQPSITPALDADLFALFSRWEAADLRQREAEKAMEASWHRFLRIAPAVPEAMFVSDEDDRRVGPYVRPHAGTKRMWYGDRDTLQMLREGYPVCLTQVRRAEILAANAAWLEETAASRRAAGCDATEAAEEAAAGEESAARHVIVRSPANTLDGLLLKARTASVLSEGEFEFERLCMMVERAIEGGSAADEIAASVLVDLCRIAQGERASDIRHAPLPVGSARGCASVGAPADPFAGYHAEILGLEATVLATEEGSPEQEAAWARWREIDAIVLASRPTTLAGVVGALEIARREHFRYSIEDCQEENIGTDDRLIQHTLEGALGVLRHISPAEVPVSIVDGSDLATPADAAAMEFEPWPDPCPTADLRRTMGEHLNTIVLGWGVCNSTKPKLVASLEAALAAGQGHLFGKLKADLDSTVEFLAALSDAVESASSRILVTASVVGTDPRHAGLTSNPFCFEPAGCADAEPLPTASAA